MDPVPPVTSSLFAQFEAQPAPASPPATPPMPPPPGSIANQAFAQMPAAPAPTPPPAPTTNDLPPPPPRREEKKPAAPTAHDLYEQRITELERQLRVAQENTVSALIQLQKRDEADKLVRQQTDLLLKETSLRRRAEETDRQTAETIAADRRRIEQLEQKLLGAISPQFVDGIAQSQKDFAARIDSLSTLVRGLTERVDEASRLSSDGISDLVAMRHDIDLLKSTAAIPPEAPDENLHAELTTLSNELRRVETRIDADRRVSAEDSTSLRKLAAELQQRIDASWKSGTDQAAAAKKEISEIAAFARHKAAEADAAGASIRQAIAASATALRHEFATLLETHAHVWKTIAGTELPNIHAKLEALSGAVSTMKSGIGDEARAAAGEAVRKAAQTMEAEIARRETESKSFMAAESEKLIRALNETGEALRASCEAQLQSALRSAKETVTNGREHHDSFKLAAEKAVEDALSRELSKASAAWRAFIDIDMAGLRTEMERIRASSLASHELEAASAKKREEMEASLMRLLEERSAALKAELTVMLSDARETANAAFSNARRDIETSNAGMLERTLGTIRSDLSRAESTIKKDALSAGEAQSKALRIFFNSEIEQLRGSLEATAALAAAAREESSIAAEKLETAMRQSQDVDAAKQLAEAAARAAAENIVAGAFERIRADSRALLAKAEESFHDELLRTAQSLRQELEMLRKQNAQKASAPLAEREEVSHLLAQQEIVMRRQFEAASERLARLRMELEGWIDERLRGVAKSLDLAHEAKRSAVETERKVELLAEGFTRRDEQMKSELREGVLARLEALEQRLSRSSDH